jgi:hypothetical protein
MWKICLSGTNTPVEGCESMTDEQVQEWMSMNQEILEEENEFGDTAKYVTLDVAVGVE